MPTWSVKKYVTSAGKCPIDKWLKGLTAKDRIRLRVAIEDIERVEKLKPNTIEKYVGTNVFELKAKGDKKQLRPLGDVYPNNTFVLFSGAIEKDGKIDRSDIDRAERLKKDFDNGKGGIRSYL